MNNRYFHKSVGLIYLVIFLTLWFIQIVRSLSFGNNSWQITEWLINYSGGFVRRGLPGEIIYYSSGISGIPANIVAIGLSVFFYALLLIFFIKFSKGRLPIVLILSPVLIGLPIYSDFLIRKDVMGVVVFIACVFLEKYLKNSLYKNLCIGVLSVFAILSHEAFFFYGVPALILIRSFLSSDNYIFDWRLVFRGIISYLPSIIAFAFAVVFKGNENVAKAINYSLIDVWRYVGPADCCFDKPSAAIDALQWSTAKGLSLSYSVLFDFSWGIYVPFAWALTIIFCFIYLISLINPKKNNSNEITEGDSINDRGCLAIILLFQLFMIAPLWVLGWDFGRWIFLWTASSFVIYLIGFDFKKINNTSLFNSINNFVNNCSIFRFPRQWHLFFVGIPGCCWSVGSALKSAPFFEFVIKLAKIVGLY